MSDLRLEPQEVRARADGRRRAPVTLVAGAALLAAVVLTAVASFVALPYPPDAIGGGRLVPPSPAHLLGTDTLGRDLLSQLMVGARIALAAGSGSVLLGGVLGVVLGLAAAFAQRALDDAIAVVLDILIAFPTLLLAMLVVAARGASLESAILAIGLAMSAVVARLTRILGKRVLAEQYVTAARASGTGWAGVVVLHVLPNVWPTLLVNLALQFGLAVLAEASLAFLGLGAPPPDASWGRLLQQAQGTVFTAPVGAIAPGLALVVLVLGANLLADGLRDALDPTRRRG